MKQVCRIIDGEPVWLDPAALPARQGGPPKPVIDDSLGCIAQQVDELRAEARLHGLSAVEFKPDLTVMQNGQPTFYRFHCDSPEQAARYAELRGLSDKNSREGSGAMLAPEHIDVMQQKMRDKYPARN